MNYIPTQPPTYGLGGFSRERPAHERVTPWRVLGDVLSFPEHLGTEALLVPWLQREHPEAYERLVQSGVRRPIAGDIYQALRPEAGPWKRLAVGTALGALVDPLTYLSGGLTVAGKLARTTKAAGELQSVFRARRAFEAARGLPWEQLSKLKTFSGGVPLAETMSEQARLGQRALLSAHIPFTELSVPLVRGEGVFRGLERLQRGELLHGYQWLESGAPWLNRMGKFVDDATTRLFQAFNVGIGMNRWFMLRWKSLLASQLGVTSHRARFYEEALGPQIDGLADEAARHFGVPFKDARARVNRVLSESMEANEAIGLARAVNGELRVARVPTGYQRDLDYFREQFGIPPAMGGPASPWDTYAVRRLREIGIQLKGEYNRILREDEDLLKRGHDLLRRSEQQYVLHTWAPEARKAHEDAMEKVLGARGFSSGLRGRLSVTHASQLQRRFRFIDEQVLEELRPKIEAIPRRGKKWNLYDLLKGKGGALPSRRAMVLTNAARSKGLLTDEEIGRLLPPMSPNQANDWIWEKGLGKVVAPRTVREWFVTDPVALLSARGARGDRAFLTKQFVEEVKGRPDLVVHESQLHLSPDRADWKPVQVSGLEGYHFHPETARWFNKMASVEANLPAHLRGFASVYDWFTTRWKGWTLSVFPVYQIRNVVGNLWNYWLGSDSLPAALDGLREVDKLLAQGPRIRNYFVRTPTGDINGAELMREVTRRGALDIGFISPHRPETLARDIQNYKLTGEISKQLARKLGLDTGYRALAGMADAEHEVQRVFRRAGVVKRWGGVIPPPAIANAIAKSPFNENNVYVTTGFHIASLLDNRVRMAMILQKLKSGTGLDEAVRASTRALFDYHDLSPLERNLRDAVFPFYSWSRKNIPFQLEMLVQHPDRIARFNDSLHSWAGWETPPEERLLNDYLAQNFPLRVRRDASGKLLYFTFKNWLPLADIFDIFNANYWATYSLHPIPKQVLEQFLNVNFFTRRKIDYLNDFLHGERTVEFGKRIPNRLAHFLNSFRLTNFWHQILDNPQELDFHTQLFRSFVGRLYPLDVDRSQHEAVMELERLNQDARRATKSAFYRNAPPAEVLRLEAEAARKRAKLETRYGYIPEE